MWVYIVRRILYAIPIIIGVNIITFALFFMVNTPDDMARMHLGDKHVSQAAVERWKGEQGYDLPLFYNAKASSMAQFTQTLFFQKTTQLMAFQFGSSNQGRNIRHDIGQRMWPSLALAIPTLIVGLMINISLALLIVLFRGTYLDTLGVISCVVLMSISGLFYIIIGQFVLGKWLQLVPISGYQGGWQTWRFLVLPVLIGVISGIDDAFAL